MVWRFISLLLKNSCHVLFHSIIYLLFYDLTLFPKSKVWRFARNRDLSFLYKTLLHATVKFRTRYSQQYIIICHDK